MSSQESTPSKPIEEIEVAERADVEHGYTNERDLTLGRTGVRRVVQSSNREGHIAELVTSEQLTYSA